MAVSIRVDLDDVYYEALDLAVELRAATGFPTTMADYISEAVIQQMRREKILPDGSQTPYEAATAEYAEMTTVASRPTLDSMGARIARLERRMKTAENRLDGLTAIGEDPDE